MTTIGDLPRPKTRSEYCFVIFELLIGLLTFATVLGYIANIVTNVSAARKDFQGTDKPGVLNLRVHTVVWGRISKVGRVLPFSLLGGRFEELENKSRSEKVENLRHGRMKASPKDASFLKEEERIFVMAITALFDLEP